MLKAIRKKSAAVGRGRAFTLVELIVVIAIMAILAGAVLVASTTLINTGKARDTSMMLGIVRDAIHEFAEEQQGRPSLARPKAYRARYGFFPPDEFEVFTSLGIPNGPTGSRAPGRAEVVPGPASSATYEAMTFRADGLTEPQRAGEHRDIGAMVLAIDLYGDGAKLMLDKLTKKHWFLPRDAAGKPLQFLDRNANETFDAMEDMEIRYLIDDWGTPLSYLAQRDFVDGPTAMETKSSNHEVWNEASTSMIRLNGGQPIVFSYGPKGPDQLTSDSIAAGLAGVGASPATLIHDWIPVATDNSAIDSALNDDNIYPDPSLREKLRRGSR